MGLVHQHQEQEPSESRDSLFISFFQQDFYYPKDNCCLKVELRGEVLFFQVYETEKDKLVNSRQSDKLLLDIYLEENSAFSRILLVLGGTLNLEVKHSNLYRLAKLIFQHLHNNYS